VRGIPAVHPHPLVDDICLIRETQRSAMELWRPNLPFPERLSVLGEGLAIVALQAKPIRLRL
jgi:hypothetical protein